MLFKHLEGHSLVAAMPVFALKTGNIGRLKCKRLRCVGMGFFSVRSRQLRATLLSRCQLN